MSSGTVIILFLVIGLPLAMVFMHRGSGGSGMGHGGHGAGNDGGHAGHGDDKSGPVLGKPGEQATPAPVVAKETRHGCH